MNQVEEKVDGLDRKVEGIDRKLDALAQSIPGIVADALSDCKIKSKK